MAIPTNATCGNIYCTNHHQSCNTCTNANYGCPAFNGKNATPFTFPYESTESNANSLNGLSFVTPALSSTTSNNSTQGASSSSSSTSSSSRIFTSSLSSFSLNSCSSATSVNVKGFSWFRLMEFILALSGLNVHTRFYFISWSIRILSVPYTHLLFLYSFYSYLNKIDDPYSLLFVLQLFFGVVTFQSIIRNQSKIAFILTQICSASNSLILNELYKFSLILFVIWLTIIGIQFSLLTCQWYFIGTKKWMDQYLFLLVDPSPVSFSHHVLVATDIIFWVLFVIGFSVGVIITFLHILYCLNKLYMNQMKILADKIEYSNCLAENLETFRQIRATHQALRETANDIFGMTVCGYIAECYLETGLRLANDDTNLANSLYSLVTDWGLYGLQVLILLSFILLLSKWSDKEENYEQRLLRKIMSNRTRQYDIDYQKMMLLLEITQSPTVPVTGWNVFIVNRSMLLGFLGSVIPFAVLITSLFEKTRHMNNNQCSPLSTNYTIVIGSILKHHYNLTLPI